MRLFLEPTGPTQIACQLAGKPKQKVLIRVLLARAVDELDDKATTLDYVVSWIESGRTMIELSKALTEDAGEEISDRYVSRYLHDTYGDEYAGRVGAARRIGAFAMVDQAIDIVDEASTFDKTHLAKAVARANVRQWTAERFNRKELGAPKGEGTTNITINSLHIDALRARNAAKLTVVSGETDTVSLAPARAFLIANDANVAEDAVDVAYVIEDEQISLL
jgi:hypothetical protein